jgi:putative CRISPR-associated protein (TIGR02619 family)
MTLFICTAGTSIAGGPLRAGESREAFCARLDEKVQRDRAEKGGRDALLVRASAETNGLARAGAGKHDEIVFLVSETEDGGICGENLVGLVERELGCRARCIQIRGLQVGDGRRFRSDGIANLLEAMERISADRMPDEIHLNATGGFKGTVPYLVLYGMFKGVKVSYVYEFSDTLITLPPFPVEFDWARIAPAEEAIFTLFRDGSLAQDRWRSLMPADYDSNREVYDPLFEFEDDLVGLSAIGHMMKSRLDAAETEVQVLLSPEARAVLDRTHGAARAHFEAMLARVRNPLHRASPAHSEHVHRTDLRVWKVYATSGPRMLYWLQGGSVLVGKLFGDHDEYERYIDGNPRQVRDYDRSAFTPYRSTTSPDYDAILLDIGRTNAEPGLQMRALEDELRSARLEIQRLRIQQNTRARAAASQAEARGRAEGRREAEARAQQRIGVIEAGKQAMREAYVAQLRQRDEQIANLKAYIEKLESKVAQVAGS